MHLAQFLCHGPTYHSLAMWRHPRTAEAGFDWAQAGALSAHRAGLRARQVRHGLLRGPELHLRHVSRDDGPGDPARDPGARARPDPAAVVHGRGHHAHRPRGDVLDQPLAPVLRRAPVGDAGSPDARPRRLERGDVAEPQPVRELRRGAPADRRALRSRPRVHRGLPQALGQLGSGRGRDGPRGGRVRRSCQGAPHRARGSVLPVSRAAQRGALPAGRPGDPAGGNVAQGADVRGAVCRRDLRDPAEHRGRQGVLRRHQARHRRAKGARPKRARSCSASSRSSGRRKTRPARSRRCTTASSRSRAAWRSSPATSTSICRRCRSTR